MIYKNADYVSKCFFEKLREKRGSVFAFCQKAIGVSIDNFWHIAIGFGCLVARSKSTSR